MKTEGYIGSYVKSKENEKGKGGRGSRGVSENRRRCGLQYRGRGRGVELKKWKGCFRWLRLV